MAKTEREATIWRTGKGNPYDGIGEIKAAILDGRVQVIH